MKNLLIWFVALVIVFPSCNDNKTDSEKISFAKVLPPGSGNYTTTKDSAGRRWVTVVRDTTLTQTVTLKAKAVDTSSFPLGSTPPVDTTTPPPPPTGSIQGYGALVTGGAGKQVVHVTNLNTSGSGSFHDAIGSNRTVVFDVAGNIPNFRWDAESKVTNLTIDGSTAPGNGITLLGKTGRCLAFEQSSNIILKNFRVRGAAVDDEVGISNNCSNMVLINLSISNGGDGNLDISESQSISVQDCIIGGGQSQWSGAMLLGYSPAKNLSIHHNLFCAITNGGVGERIPFIRGDESSANYNDMIVEFKENLVWGWGRNGGTGSGYATGIDFAGTGQIINNYYYSKSDPGSAIKPNADPQNGSGGKYYVSGNYSKNGSSFPASNTPIWVIPAQYQVTTQSPQDAAKSILLKAGCFPRDATDQQYINSVSL